MSEKSRENNFWNEFDHTFNLDLGADKDLADAAGVIMSFSYSNEIGSLNSDGLRQILKTNTEETNNLKKAVENLAIKYVSYFTKYLGDNFGDENFEDGSKPFDLFSAFGQGLLYDPVGQMQYECM